MINHQDGLRARAGFLTKRKFVLRFGAEIEKLARGDKNGDACLHRYRLTRHIKILKHLQQFAAKLKTPHQITLQKPLACAYFYQLENKNYLKRDHKL